MDNSQQIQEERDRTEREKQRYLEEMNQKKNSKFIRRTKKKYSRTRTN